MEDLDDLLSRCRAGDPSAWEGLVRRFEGRIYGFALHYMRDPEEARDVSQEIFIKMYRHLDGIHDGRTYLPWMLRLARNCCLDRLRGQKARVRPVDGGLFESAASDASPEEAMLREDRKDLFYRALGTLNAANREIVLLKDIREFSLADIAARLGLPLGTVKSRSNRARAELAKAVRSRDAPVEAAP